MICASICLFNISVFAKIDTLRILTYNVSDFPDRAEERNSCFALILNEIKADIVAVQEITDTTGVNIFLSQILNSPLGNIQYLAAPFIDGFDSDNALFYNKDKLVLKSSRQIQTDLRDISEYIMKSAVDDSGRDFYIYSLHLKAGNSSEAKSLREYEATILRNELNKLPPGTEFFVLGDFNFYTSSETGFKVISDETPIYSKCFDPTGRTGSWNDNKKYAELHTQSTHLTRIGSFESGGLDDRFDFIFISNALFDLDGLFYLPSSYITFGNDGRHFDMNINDSTNAFGQDIADALYCASDHLPVYLDVVVNYTNQSKVKQEYLKPVDFTLCQNYPNPFNKSTNINFSLTASSTVILSVYSLRGELIKKLDCGNFSAGINTIRLNTDNLLSGIYYYELQIGQQRVTKKMVILK